MYAETYRGRSVLTQKTPKSMQKSVPQETMQYRAYKEGIDKKNRKRAVNSGEIQKALNLMP